MTDRDRLLAEIQATLAQADAVIQRGLQIERDAQELFNSLGVEPQQLFARIAEQVPDSERTNLEHWFAQQLASVDLPPASDAADHLSSGRSGHRRWARSMA